MFLRCKKVLHYWFDWRYICAMQIGYARVSTDDQDTAAQVAALKATLKASWQRAAKEHVPRAGPPRFWGGDAVRGKPP